jgi:hypothetical protein
VVSAVILFKEVLTSVTVMLLLGKLVRDYVHDIQDLIPQCHPHAGAIHTCYTDSQKLTANAIAGSVVAIFGVFLYSFLKNYSDYVRSQAAEAEPSISHIQDSLLSINQHPGLTPTAYIRHITTPGAPVRQINVTAISTPGAPVRQINVNAPVRHSGDPISHPLAAPRETSEGMT